MTGSDGGIAHAPSRGVARREPVAGTREASWKRHRWLPLVALLALMVLAIAMGWHNYLSFKTVGLNYGMLKRFIAEHLYLALAAFIFVYSAVVAISLPGGAIMTMAGGLLFGWQLGTPAAVLGATIGATILFLTVRTSLGDTLATRAGPLAAKLRDGFNENALNYLLFLRLVPLFPFWLVNLAPALLGVPLRTFVIGTAIGIIPGTAAYCFAGAGLGSVIKAQNASYANCLANQADDETLACDYSIDTGALITPELLVAFALLGVVALIPVGVKRWSKRNAAA